MAILNMKLSVQTNVSSRTRKYLGEPDDLHFIPDSPLIERQAFTEQEEEELKRACALVLANVPHSDDMSDDPLRYLATQIEEGKTARQTNAKREHRPEPVRPVAHNLANLDNDTATPSESSPRDTVTTTTFSTPPTTAGLTPAENGRRFSDAPRKSITSSKKPGSSLRNETLPETKSRTTSSAGAPKSFEANKTSAGGEAAKFSLRLVKADATHSMDDAKLARFSPPDLNKSLPPPPAETASLDDQRQPHISRLMKSIRKKRSMTTVDRSFSSTGALPSPLVETAKAAALNLSPETPPAPVPQMNSSEVPKRRFRLRLFSRRQRPASVLAS